MGSKLSAPSSGVLKYTYDFSLAPQSVVGVVDLGELPENFIVESVYIQELVAVTATTTIKAGPTADDDGFCLAADITAAPVKGVGALQAADAADIDYVVPAAQSLLLTTAVAPAITGKVVVMVKGFQAF